MSVTGLLFTLSSGLPRVITAPSSGAQVTVPDAPVATLRSSEYVSVPSTDSVSTTSPRVIAAVAVGSADCGLAVPPWSFMTNAAVPPPPTATASTPAVRKYARRPRERPAGAACSARGAPGPSAPSVAPPGAPRAASSADDSRKSLGALTVSPAQPRRALATRFPHSSPAQGEEEG